MSRSGSRPQGYTIVEAMIFLAVSGMLFVSAMLFVSGQQNRTEFAQAANEIESQLQDIMNDVSTGYYYNSNNFSCQNVGGVPQVTSAASNNQGANTDCIFLGRVLHFGVHGTNRQGYNVYTAVGLRQYGSPPQESIDFVTAKATIINPSINTDSHTLSNGLQIIKMQYSDSSGAYDIGAFGFIGSFGRPDPSFPSRLTSGKQQVFVVPIAGTVLDQTPSAIVFDPTGNDYNNRNPSGGVTLCFKRGITDNQYVMIVIGSNGRELSTQKTIGSGSCP